MGLDQEVYLAYICDDRTTELKCIYKLDLLRDRVSELEQSLVESDHLKQEYLQEKNRSVWEWQKTQKVGEIIDFFLF